MKHSQCIADHGFEENERRCYRAAQRTLADLRSSTEKSNTKPPTTDQKAETP